MASTFVVTFTTVSAPILKPSSSSVSNRSAALHLGLRFESRRGGSEFSTRRSRGGMQSSSLDVVRASASSASASSTSPAAEAAEKQKEAAVMVQEFYAAINRREISSIGDLFADDCIYEDLVFPKPFAGRKAILEFFQKFMDSVGSELEFRVDDITTGDPDAAGVIWHLDWNGRPLPFSKGCSFYRCKVINGNRQFVYGRDAVEPATKPGNFTLVALKGLAALLRTFPSLVDRF